MSPHFVLTQFCIQPSTDQPRKVNLSQSPDRQHILIELFYDAEQASYWSLQITISFKKLINEEHFPFYFLNVILV